MRVTTKLEAEMPCVNLVGIDEQREQIMHRALKQNLSYLLPRKFTAQRDFDNKLKIHESMIVLGRQ